MAISTNPFLLLKDEAAFASLGGSFFDEVPAAPFPQHLLRFRNDCLLPKLGLDPGRVMDSDFIQAFGKFEGRSPFRAMCYHGYQFGEYNPQLGDGRGFLYGQFRGVDGRLYDLGTKGSGTTPYSRYGDGRLTLKGGIREILAAEALHYAGVTTSRCLSLVETGEALWRGDEPSPTRSSVMIRMSRSHIRFGTFERLHFLQRPDLLETLIDHVVKIYYPELLDIPDRQQRYVEFYRSVVRRTAILAAQWMAAGFCHAVLNTDNMSIVGESFDYGPYAFIERFDPNFTAAYFDYWGYYRFGLQPDVCKENLIRLQRPLARVIDRSDLEEGLVEYDDLYQSHYRRLILNKLGIGSIMPRLEHDLVKLTLQFLVASPIQYHSFFIRLAEQFTLAWQDQPHLILADTFELNAEPQEALDRWRRCYYQVLQTLPDTEMELISDRLQRHNPKTVLLRSEIEAVWEPITHNDDWDPFYDLVQKIQSHPDPDDLESSTLINH